MNKYAIEASHHRVLIWIIWFLVLLACLLVDASRVQIDTVSAMPLSGVVTHDKNESGPLFPWRQQGCWKKWAWRR